MLNFVSRYLTLHSNLTVRGTVTFIQKLLTEIVVRSIRPWESPLKMEVFKIYSVFLKTEESRCNIDLVSENSLFSFVNKRFKFVL